MFTAQVKSDSVDQDVSDEDYVNVASLRPMLMNSPETWTESQQKTDIPKGGVTRREKERKRAGREKGLGVTLPSSS